MWTAVGVRLLVVLALVVSGVRLGNRKTLLVPLEAPFILLSADLLVLAWLFSNGWGAGVNRMFLMGLLLIGFLVFAGQNGKRRWYLLKTGGFAPLDPLYDDIAQLLRNHLWLENLPPAAVVLYKDGRIGFQNMDDGQIKAAEALLQERFEDEPDRRLHQNWRRFLWVHFWCMVAIMIYTFF